jgi:hypothetical protein
VIVGRKINLTSALKFMFRYKLMKCLKFYFLMIVRTNLKYLRENNVLHSKEIYIDRILDEKL